MPDTGKRFLQVLLALLGILALLQQPAARCEDDKPTVVEVQQETISTLKSLLVLKSELETDIAELNRRLDAAKTQAEKANIQAQLEKLDADLQTTSGNLNEIAAGVDISDLRAGEEKPFNFQEELLSLLRPALKEMKDMTSHVRQKSELKDKIAYYEERLPLMELAVANVTALLGSTENENLRKYLQETLAESRKRLTFMQSELRSAGLQLAKLERSEASLAEASQSYFKAFFRQRGLYLMQALLVVLGVLLLSRLSYRAMVRLIPGYRKEHRSFRLRLLDLAHRITTIVLAIIGPMVVFYIAEDWLLFSLGILLLLGIGLTL
ncbi:MAG: hypothetical protein PVF08_09720, partial [Gammaproteobacteria bacterium]